MNNPLETSQAPYSDEETSIDLRQYLALFLQWWWLIALAALLAGGAAYFFSQQVEPVYRASTTLLLNEAPFNRTADLSSMATSERLAQTYSQMMVKRPVLEEVIKRLEINYSAGQLQGMITVKPVSNTQLLTITVDSPDMSLSPAIANALVVVFTEQLYETQSSRFALSKSSLESQIADTEAKIELVWSDLKAAKDIDEIERLETRLNQYEELHGNLLISYEGIRTTEAQIAAKIEQIEVAVVNPYPVNQNIMQNTMLGMIVGLMLALGGVFFFDMLDDKVKGPEEVTRELKLPVLGAIVQYEEPEDGRMITQDKPRSPIAESFRSLRTNVQYSSVDAPIKTLLVTSPTPSDGKTTVAANLAVVMAQNNRQVTLLDADLHRPRVHRVFNVDHQPGLSGMFVQPDVYLNGEFQSTPVKSLHVVSAGKLPPNPSELLGSNKMRQILDAVLERSDMVILDSPPVLSVNDAVVLAPVVDAVIIVARPGRTRMNELKAAVEQLRYVGANVIGVVLNGIDEKNRRYGYYNRGSYYKAYNSYGGSHDSSSGDKRTNKKIRIPVK